MESTDLYFKRQQLKGLLAAVRQLTDRDSVGALEKAEEATTLARELGQSQDLAHSLILQAHQLMRLTRFEETFRRLEEAQPLCEAQGNREGLADIANIRGMTRAQLGQFTQALDDLEAAYELRRTLITANNLSKQATLLNNMALVWTWLHSFETALELFQEAHQLAIQTPDLFTQGITLGNQGFVHIKRGYFLLQKGLNQARPDFEAALQIYTRLLEHARSSGYEILVLLALRNLSNAHITLGHVGEGLDLNQESLALSLKLSEKRAEGLSWIDFGRGWAVQGHLDKAQEAFVLGLNTLQEAQAFEDLTWQYSEYAAFLQSLGRSAEAYVELKKALMVEQNHNHVVAERQAQALKLRLVERSRA